MDYHGGEWQLGWFGEYTRLHEAGQRVVEVDSSLVWTEKIVFGT